MSTQQIIREIYDYIRQRGSAYPNWYVGIASDPRQRLFVDHNVDEHNGAWISRNCQTHTAARQVEEYFLNLGCRGGTGGGDHTTRYAYAYKITSSTRE